ncbi:MAG: hypothetical protein LBT30_05405 [Clostridiales bacterium]|jgi:hypothetical protein|nr:hypothetical protein [Clostridiales bacterium]
MKKGAFILGLIMTAVFLAAFIVVLTMDFSFLNNLILKEFIHTILPFFLVAGIIVSGVNSIIIYKKAGE